MSEYRPPIPFYEDTSISEGFDDGARRVQKAFWDAQAERWDPRSAGLQPHHLGDMEAWLKSPVLLVGAGRGTMLEALRSKGLTASGVDWSANMVAEAHRDGVTDLSYGDAALLPAEDLSLASVVFSTGILLPTHTQRRREAYLDEARRVLIPGGHLILCLFYRKGSMKARRAGESVRLPIHTLRATTHWDLGPLAASLSSRGFRSVRRVQCCDLLIWSTVKQRLRIEDGSGLVP